MHQKIKQFLRDQHGANAIEYALVLAFIAVAIIGSLRSLDSSIGSIISGWGPTTEQVKPKPIGNPNNAFGFQNLTQVEIKTLYLKNQNGDKADGISIDEWVTVYESVTGTKPSNVSVKSTFEQTDQAVSSGGNADGKLDYLEFKAAILNSSY